MAKLAKSLEDMIRSRTASEHEVDVPSDTSASTNSNPNEGATPVASKKSNIEKVTLYIPRTAYKFIKQVALDHDKKPHDVLLDGIDAVLRQHGKSLRDFKD